jgi:hypothetical protein
MGIRGKLNANAAARLPRFAEGGLVAAGGGRDLHPVTMHFAGNTVHALMTDDLVLMPSRDELIGLNIDHQRHPVENARTIQGAADPDIR